MKTITIETSVLGGLPVSIEAQIESPDREVGIMNYYVDDWAIVAINGRTCKTSPKWLYPRISSKKGEEQSIIDAIMEEYSNR